MTNIYLHVFQKLCELIFKQFNIIDDQSGENMSKVLENIDNEFGLTGLITAFKLHKISPSSFVMNEIDVWQKKPAQKRVCEFCHITAPFVVHGYDRNVKIFLHMVVMKCSDGSLHFGISEFKTSAMGTELLYMEENAWGWYESINLKETGSRTVFKVWVRPEWTSETHLEHSIDVRQTVTVCLALSRRRGKNSLQRLPLELLCETFCLLSV